MPLTTDQAAWLRAELGATPDDADLAARFDRLESVRDVAIEVLRERRQGLIDKPLQANLSGVASYNYSENVKALERRIQSLVAMDDDPSDDPAGGDVDTLGRPDVHTYPLARSRRR